MSALIYIDQTALWVYQELQINKLKMNRCLCSEFVVSDTDATLQNFSYLPPLVHYSSSSGQLNIMYMAAMLFYILHF